MPFLLKQIALFFNKNSSVQIAFNNGLPAWRSVRRMAPGVRRRILRWGEWGRPGNRTPTPPCQFARLRID